MIDQKYSVIYHKALLDIIGPKPPLLKFALMVSILAFKESQCIVPQLKIPRTVMVLKPQSPIPLGGSHFLCCL